MPKRQQDDDEDWTRCQSSSEPKNQPLPQSPQGNCILHGFKEIVNDNFIALASKADPLSAFGEIHDMKNKLLTEASHWWFAHSLHTTSLQDVNTLFSG